MKVTYANLGANHGKRNMYIRSTDLESGNWISLLMSFPDEALYFMTKGKEIVIVDRCNKLRGKVERIFCPVFEDFLAKISCGVEPKHKALNHHLRLAMQAYRSNAAIFRKYEFFKHKLKTHKVAGVTIKMDKEPSVWK